MAKHTIHLFMWGYQPHHRILLEVRAKEILKLVGADTEPKVLLVGARIPKSNNPNPACIEPEDGEWPLSIFTGLLELIEVLVKGHRLQGVFYGDEASMRDKPEVIRRDSVTQAVRQALLPYDAELKVHSFCGGAYPVDHYYVVPVIQIPQSVLSDFHH